MEDPGAGAGGALAQVIISNHNIHLHDTFRLNDTRVVQWGFVQKENVTKQPRV